MREITMFDSTEKSFKEVYEEFVISRTARGFSDTTLVNYRYHMKNISKYLDIDRAFDSITKRDIEQIAAAMRKNGIAHNSIATYMRLLKTFYNWCAEENLSRLKFVCYN